MAPCMWEVSDLVSVGSTATLMTAASDDAPKPNWCNFLYSTRCPFCTDSNTRTYPCKFAHIDTCVNMGAAERHDSGLPNLMTRHMRNLVRELTRIVDDKAQRVMNAWMVVRACGGAEGPVSPYMDTVAALRNLGWVISEAEQGAWTKLEDTPYARDVASILGLVASCLHYDFTGCTDIMFRTVAWVVGEEAPVLLGNAGPRCEADDVAGALLVETTSEVGDYEDMPELLDPTCCAGRSSHLCGC